MESESSLTTIRSYASADVYKNKVSTIICDAQPPGCPREFIEALREMLSEIVEKLPSHSPFTQGLMNFQYSKVSVVTSDYVVAWVPSNHTQ